MGIAAGLSAADPSYFREIRPILQRQCQGCHQPNLKSSGLDLTSYDALKGGGKRGPAVSLLVRYLTGETKPQMPLGMPALPAEQIDLVRNWVAAGAKDDTPDDARETVSAGAPTVYSQPPVPVRRSSKWARTKTGCSGPSSASTANASCRLAVTARPS